MMSQGSTHRRASARRHADRRAGFTLIELILVVALIGILAGITVAAYSQWIPRVRLRGTAEEVAVVMQRARLHAIRTNQRVTVRLESAAAPAIDQWIIAFPQSGSADQPILRVTIPKPAATSAHVIAISGFPGGDLFYRGDGTVEAMGWFELTDQKTTPNRLRIALDSLSGSQPKIRKFLLPGDRPGSADATAPGVSDGFFEQTLGSSNKNFWVWY